MPAACALAALALAGCTRSPQPAATLDASKVASVVIGRSSRTDVFAALGQPSRTEQSRLGEAWVYEPKSGDSSQGLMSGAGTAAGIVGSFVPYVGLIGSGLGLAGSAMNGPAAEASVASLTVSFGENGVVRDCLYSSTAAPTGLAGPAAAPAAVGCRQALGGVSK